MFKWIYGPNDSGPAIVTASDRMITAGDVEYEPNQTKICVLTRNVLILIAGDYVIHSEALIHLQRQLVALPEIDPGVIAESYAAYIRQIKYRHAANRILAPVGLDHESFYEKQHALHPDLLARLSNQLQNYESPNTEAIVAGTDNRGIAQLYLVDQHSVVSCHNDVGFIAIGIGAWHAKSTLMRAGYINSMQYAVAAGMAYAAKKAGEIAPGVGKTATDMHLVTRVGWELVLPAFKTKIESVYADFDKKRNDLAIDAIKELDSFLSQFGKPSDATQTGNTALPPEDTGS